MAEINKAASTVRLPLNDFSRHLFWDVDIKTLQADEHAAFIIARVLEYGLYSDWRILLAYYGIKKIVAVARKIKELDKKTASFLALLGGISAKDFACYTSRQFSPKHWNF